jgi:hypothetical protein
MDSPLVITRARRITLAVGVPLILAVIVLVALDLLARVSPTSTTINTVAAIQGTSLAVSADEGNLTLVPSADNRVHVSGTAFSSFAAPRLHWSTSGSAMALGLQCAPLPGSCSLSARIAVPPQVRVTATDRSGSITASGLRGGADLSTNSGNIQVSDVGGDLSLGSNSGSVSGAGLLSKVAVVSNQSGDISLRFAVVPDRVQVEDQSGDISLIVPRRPYKVSAQANSGTTTVDVPTDPLSHQVISAVDDSGDITIQPDPH